MSKAIRLSAEQREDLVAYLDGELDPQNADAIDQALVASPVARHEVEIMARTWEMLDLLDRPKASTQFSTKTLATLRLENVTKPSIFEHPLWKQLGHWGILALVVGGLGAASAVGTWLGQRAIPSPHDRLLQDLPVLERFNMYRDLGDAELLRDVKRQKLLDE